MNYYDVANLSYAGGGVIFAALALALTQLYRRGEVHWLLILASLASIAWHFSIAAYDIASPRNEPSLLILEILRYGSWISALTISLQFSNDQKLPTRIRRCLHGIWALSLALALGLVAADHPALTNSSLLVWNSLILSIAGLITVEQLYRNTPQNRLLKLLSLTMGAIFSYDLYLFSYSLIFDGIPQNLWQSRGAINGIAAFFMTLSALTIANAPQQTASIQISRPVVFYTTGMTVAGLFLVLMAAGGYYIQLHGGSWGVIIQTLIVFSACFIIAVVSISKNAHSRINVWISKNFFRHKYDYRVEWLKLINSLSQPAEHEADFHERAIKVVSSIFKSPGGWLWLESNGSYSPVHSYNVPQLASDYTADKSSAFCLTLHKNEWVFSPHSSTDDQLSQFNNTLPRWTYELPQLWLILPLLTEEGLLGFMALATPKHDSSLTWEDLDLLKTVGRQVSSYLDRHEAAELLAQSKQFDAFNKLTAFIMHDLKNLIAQQALVVENAAKHKENPAFIEDAIQTIDNSVSRMSNLLKRLQQQGPAEVKNLDLQKVLVDAVKKCTQNKPAPSLHLEAENLRVDADQDQLIMTLANIIKNAQDATDTSGFIDVTLRGDGNNAVITIEDNGSGMDDDFIRTRLFKPFDTTKSGKGMGIGVYQTREFITSLGGKIDVESTLTEGTTFTLSIPATAV